MLNKNLKKFGIKPLWLPLSKKVKSTADPFDRQFANSSNEIVIVCGAAPNIRKELSICFPRYQVLFMMGKTSQSRAAEHLVKLKKQHLNVYVLFFSDYQSESIAKICKKYKYSNYQLKNTADGFYVDEIQPLATSPKRRVTSSVKLEVDNEALNKNRQTYKKTTSKKLVGSKSQIVVNQKQKLNIDSEIKAIRQKFNIDISEAHDALNKLWSYSPWDRRLVNIFAAYYRKCHKFDDALWMLDKAIERAPYWTLYKERSLTRRAKGDLSIKAIDDARLAWINAPKSNVSILKDYIWCLWSIKGISPELLDACKIFETNSVNSTADDLITIASIYNETGRYVAANKNFNKALEKDSSILQRAMPIPLLATASNLDFNQDNQFSKFKSIYEKLQAKTGDFERSIKASKFKFCIVGNGPTEVGTMNGNEIDKNTIVIRFNAYSTDFTHRVDYGSKTTIWVKTTHYIEVPRRDDNLFKSVVVSGYNVLHRNPSSIEIALDMPNKSIDFIPNYVYEELIVELEGMPSAGMAILFWIYKLVGPIPNKCVYGFSMGNQEKNKNEHYFTNTKQAGYYSHRWDNEAILLRKIIT
ncbi:MAG: hypothetical protein ACJASL_001093 [Paraglaciecola sp.]|jgi:hypothetical protein